MLYGLADAQGAWENPYLAALSASTNANAARVLVGHDDIGSAGADAAVDAVLDAGQTPIICLWTVTDFTDHNPSNPDGYYAGRVVAALQRWPAPVLVECFNEPNLTAAFIPGYEFTISTAAQAVATAVQAAEFAGEGGRIIGPAIASQGEPSLDYQDALYYTIDAMGGLDDMHGMATHIYPSAPYPNPTPLSAGQAEWEHYIARAWAGKFKPIYVTESGWQAGVYGDAGQDTYSVWSYENYDTDPRIGGVFSYRLAPDDPVNLSQHMSISQNHSLRTALTNSWGAVTSAPETTITAGPTGTITTSSTSFSFISSDAGVSVNDSLTKTFAEAGNVLRFDNSSDTNYLNLWGDEDQDGGGRGLTDLAPHRRRDQLPATDCGSRTSAS